jgi:purine-binding chemotaxis protein CheW
MAVAHSDFAYASETPSAGLELLSVRIGANQFALDIRSVREIRGGMAATPLPHAPDYLKGMINLRGQILAVIDLAQRLGLPPIAADVPSVVIVVEMGSIVAGLLVDDVCDILNVAPGQIQPSPVLGGDELGRMVSGVMNSETGIISVLSVADIVPQTIPDLVAAAA